MNEDNISIGNPAQTRLKDLKTLYFVLFGIFDRPRASDEKFRSDHKFSKVTSISSAVYYILL